MLALASDLALVRALALVLALVSVCSLSRSQRVGRTVGTAWSSQRHSQHLYHLTHHPALALTRGLTRGLTLTLALTDEEVDGGTSAGWSDSPLWTLYQDHRGPHQHHYRTQSTLTLMDLELALVSRRTTA